MTGRQVPQGSNISPSPWPRERIESYLAKEWFDYQKIPLPYGLETKGHDRKSTADLIFDRDLSGKSVLDVGSSLGYFCFEAERRGATDVWGIDVHPDSVRKAKILAEMKGSTVRFLQGDLEHTGFDRPFDYVLCLNVLHHLHDPLGALNRLIDLTREKLILEVATFGWHDKKKVGLPGFLCRWLSRLPIIFVTATGTRGDREVQRFYMSRGAITNLLLVHRGVFARLEVKESPHKGRFVVIAHKRRIGHLLIVAGPTSSGKKTLEKRLLENRLPEVVKVLGTPDTTVWGPVLSASHIDERDEPVRERVLLHYDIMRPLMRSTRVYERDEAMDLLSCAARVTVLTVLTPAERLRAQITAAEIDRKVRNGKSPKRRHLRVRDFYSDQAKVDEVYRSWIEFVGKHTAEHWMIEATDGDAYRLLPASEYASR